MVSERFCPICFLPVCCTILLTINKGELWLHMHISTQVPGAKKENSFLWGREGLLLKGCQDGKIVFSEVVPGTESEM